MPINPATLIPVFSANLAGCGLLGPSVPQLAAGLAVGLSQYVVSGVTVTTMDVGTLGVGVGTGAAVLTPAQVMPVASSLLASSGIVGPSAAQLAVGLANSISTSVSMGVVTTASTSVSTGAGTGTLVPTSAFPTIAGALQSAGLVGPTSAVLAQAFSMIIDASLPMAVVTVAIAGPISPVAATGVGVGKIY